MVDRLILHVRRLAPLLGAVLAVLFALAVEAEAARHEFSEVAPPRYGHAGTGHVF